MRKLSMLWKKLPLILLPALIVGIASFALLSQVYPFPYLYKTRAVVTSPIEDVEQILTSDEALQSIAVDLNFAVTPNQIRSTTTLSVIPNTSLTVITVRYSDPTLAAGIANGIADQNEQRFDMPPQFAQLLDSLTNTLRDSQAKLQQINQELNLIENEIALWHLVHARTFLTEQIAKQTHDRAALKQLLQSISDRRSTLTTVERATIPVNLDNDDRNWQVALIATVTTLLVTGAIILKPINLISKPLLS